MKVLYLIHHAGSGGAERYVEHLASHLPGCGLCYTVEGPLCEKLHTRGIHIHHLKMRSPLDFSAAKALADLCRTHGYDVIHAQFPRENCIAILSRLFSCRARVVYTAHLIQHQPPHWRLLNRILTPHDHRIIAVCRPAADALVGNGICPDRIQIIPNGIDPSHIPPRDRRPLTEFDIREEALILLALTRFSPEKGLDTLCDAIALLKHRTGIPFRLLLTGDGAEFSTIQAKVQALGLQDTILLPGRRDDAPALLSAADIYVNTSRTEAMSFAILEAMAAGLPVVATNVGGTPDLLDDTCGILIPPDDPDACAAALLSLLEAPTLRTRLGQSARERATQKFTLDQMCTATERTYQP